MANNDDEDIIEDRETTKKVYRSPRLHCYGTLRELTLHVGKCGNPDGHKRMHTGIIALVCWSDFVRLLLLKSVLKSVLDDLHPVLTGHRR